jgi:hypothetical protein
MYDDSIGSNYSNVHRHWYDEPPYESDPDDFLMTGMGAAAKIQVRHMEKALERCKPKLLNCKIIFFHPTFLNLSFPLLSSRAVVFALRQTVRE